MEHKNKLVVTLPSDIEILCVRTFDAPRELVYKAMTDSDLIPKWWGPRYLTTRVDKMEVKPGGAWRFIQSDKDGNEFAFNGVYREIVPPKKTVSTFEFEPLAGHISVETVELEEVDGKTRMVNLTKFDSQEDRDGMLKSGMEEGQAETLDRLEELLAEMKKEKTHA